VSELRESIADLVLRDEEQEQEGPVGPNRSEILMQSAHSNQRWDPQVLLRPARIPTTAALSHEPDQPSYRSGDLYLVLLPGAFRRVGPIPRTMLSFNFEQFLVTFHSSDPVT